MTSTDKRLYELARDALAEQEHTVDELRAALTTSTPDMASGRLELPGRLGWAATERRAT